MPPRKPKSAKSASSMTSKSGGSRRPVEPGMAPSSTRDPTLPQVNKELLQRDKRELISSFQEQLDIKYAEHDKEVKRTIGQIHYLRKDNERMQRRQLAEYGMTLDTLDELRATLDVTKTQNDKLYEDMAQSKDLHDKLEEELKEARQKFEDAKKQIEILERDSKTRSSIKKQCLKSEARCDELKRNNKKLKIILMKHHINPNVDAREFSREKYEAESAKTVRTHPEFNRKITVRGRYGNLFGEVEMLRQMNKEDLKKGYGVLDSTFDQVSPAYLGYYIKQRQARNEPASYYRPGVQLPRIMPRY